MTTKTHGGVRSGAGRPPIFSMEGRSELRVILSKAHKRKLKRLVKAGEYPNASELIRDWIDQEAERL